VVADLTARRRRFLDMPVANNDGTALVYDSVGDGAPLVLVHGSWGERNGFAFVVPGLSQLFRVVSYDRRGHGESGGDPESGTVHDDVADLATVIEASGSAPAHVVASSYGGCIALRLAAQRPELIQRLVCHEPPLLGVLEATAKGKAIADEEWRKLGEVQRLLERGDHRRAAEHFVEKVALGPGAWELLPSQLQEIFVTNAPTFLSELRDPDALGADLDALKRISVPVTLTEGDQSPAFFRPVIDELMDLLPDVSRVLLPTAGHVPHATHPDQFIETVRSALLDDR
jgi:pimeloyl-ACP methyl ester carboxylesterase